MPFPKTAQHPRAHTAAHVCTQYACTKTRAHQCTHVHAHTSATHAPTQGHLGSLPCLLGQCPPAAETAHHQASGLKPPQLILSQHWGQGAVSQQSGVYRHPLLMAAHRRHLCVIALLCVTFLSLTGTFVIGFRAHPHPLGALPHATSMGSHTLARHHPNCPAMPYCAVLCRTVRAWPCNLTAFQACAHARTWSGATYSDVSDTGRDKNTRVESILHAGQEAAPGARCWGSESCAMESWSPGP